MDSLNNGAQQSDLNYSNLVTIRLEDIQPELDYWTNSVVVYVLGSNPPLIVMNGFLRRVWKCYGVDKVGLLNKGTYLVRMNSEEGMMKAMATGVQFFDKKPVIVNMWIKLHGLDFKYWNDNVLEKLLNSIGKFCNADQSTEDRNKLLYARVLVEMRLDKTWEQTLHFINKKVVMVTQAIEYEWMPTYYGQCKVFRHDNTQCKKMGKPNRSGSQSRLLCSYLRQEKLLKYQLIIKSIPNHLKLIKMDLP
ncbi:2-succinylbenzoate--CoA ligase [Bienertia sinuspersici]